MISAVNERGPQPGAGSPRQSLVTAEAAWGNDLDDWIVVLATACDNKSQNMIAKKMGYSGSVVSSVINRTYKGDYKAVEKATRGCFMAETLECPVLGELKLHICLGHQKRAVNLNPTSGMRVQLAKACRSGCVHARFSFGHGDEES